MNHESCALEDIDRHRLQYYHRKINKIYEEEE
jgi:hypothetical protein